VLLRSAVLERERVALGAHRATLRGFALPPPKAAPRGTFVHGLLLPFSLILATIRDRDLRGPYLRLVLARAAVVVVVAMFAFHGAKPAHEHHGPSLVLMHDKKTPRGESTGSATGKGLHVHVPGVNIDLDKGSDDVEVLGKKIPVVDPDAKPAEPPPVVGVLGAVEHGWRWLAALLALLSTLEGMVVFVSRRYDDWLSFHASRLAAVRPEDETPKTRKLAFDVKWLVRKTKRRVRGYLVFGAGLPALWPLELVPTVGPWLFSAALTLWGWYWLGVFSAGKSAHAWADAEAAPSPKMIRVLHERIERTPRLLAPLRPYARLWAWLTRDVNPAATTFERSPAPFLGLAVARAILALPGLYLLARPIVPIAAGRLCAEADPADRFSTSA
jgi:hypothetical protein